MDQHLPQLHDLNVALCRAPELPVGQGRGGFLPIGFHVQVDESLNARSLLTAGGPFRYDLLEAWASPGASDPLYPTLASRQEVPVIELLPPSRYLSARFARAGLQITAKAATGKNWMPRRLLDGALARVNSGL